jgi:hypothetical protein
MKMKQSGVSAGMSRGLINSRAAKTSYLVILGIACAILTQLINAEPVKLKVCTSPQTTTCPFKNGKYGTSGIYELQADFTKHKTIDTDEEHRSIGEKLVDAGKCKIVNFNSQGDSVYVKAWLMFHGDSYTDLKTNRVRKESHLAGDFKSIDIKKGDPGWNVVGACGGDNQVRVTLDYNCKTNIFSIRPGAAPCD